MLCIVMGLPWNENGIIDTFHPLPLHQPITGIRFLGPGFGSFTVGAGRGEVTVNITYTRILRLLRRTVSGQTPCNVLQLVNEIVRLRKCNLTWDLMFLGLGSNVYFLLD